MTEAEWTTCTDPMSMLAYIQGKVSNRKFRLFAVACCQRIWHLMRDRECRKAVEAAESYADGMVNDRFLARTEAAVTTLVLRQKLAAWTTSDEYVRYLAAGAAQCTAKWGHIDYFAMNAAYYASKARSAAEGIEESESEVQCLLIREIVGNPFRQVTLGPRCRTHEVTKLAQTIYDERAFERFHYLNNILQNNNCDVNSLTVHCCDTSIHVRGCWVLDAILGKT